MAPLKLDDAPVTVDQVISTTALEQLSYTPQSTFTGTDQWVWNGSDGMDYSTVDAKVTVNIAPVTHLVAEVSSHFKAYPNPVSSTLQVETTTPHGCSVSILDMTGRKVISTMIITPIPGSPSELDLSNLPEGVYIVRIQSATPQLFHQKIIKK